MNFTAHVGPQTLLSQLTQSLTPAQLDIIKVLALIAMVLDHFNTLFLTHPDPLLYTAGRMAFPLFTFIWAINVLRDPGRLQIRANRLWVWALITQPAFTLTFQHQMPWYALNILFVFAAVTQLLALYHRYGWKGLLAGTFLLAVLVKPLMPCSFGLAGLALAISMALTFSVSSPTRFGIVAVSLSLFFLNGTAHLISQPADTLLLAILPTLVLPWMAVVLVLQVSLLGNKRFMPPRFFYFAYAGHLLLAGLLLQF